MRINYKKIVIILIAAGLLVIPIACILYYDSAIAKASEIAFEEYYENVYIPLNVEGVLGAPISTTPDHISIKAYSKKEAVGFSFCSQNIAFFSEVLVEGDSVFKMPGYSSLLIGNPVKGYKEIEPEFCH